MLRATVPNIKNVPMPTDKLNKVVADLRRDGATVIIGTKQVEKHLKRQGALGLTLNDIIMFSQNPSRATVYEERFHFLVWKNPEHYGILDDELGTDAEEILVKNLLLKHADIYELTDDEIMQTKAMIKYHERKLTER